MFRWAVSYELIPAEAHRRLCTLESLAGERAAPVGPAPEMAVEAVRSRVTSVVRAMIDVQLATGMRPGELVLMRPCDIDMSGDVWVYTPEHHKTKHRGKRRVVAIGPRAQQALAELPRVQLHFLPPYSPEFNPIEREWRLLHAEVTRNHCCTTIDELTGQVRRYLAYRNRVKGLRRRRVA